MSWFSVEHLHQLISTYGYGAVGAIVAMESMGLPAPGEIILIVSAVYASTHHDLNIWGAIAVAAAGAILGDNIGYWLGRSGRNCSGGVPYLPRAADRTRSRRQPARCEHRDGPDADPNGLRRNTGLRQGIPLGGDGGRKSPGQSRRSAELAEVKNAR
jgi:hypothetical protein